MKSYLLLIIPLILFISCNQPTSLDNDKSKELFRHYNFSITIDVTHLLYNNDFNYKYVINKNFDLPENYPTYNFSKKKLYYITYNFMKPNKNQEYKRMPIDTVSFRLTEQQLDSIYSLTTKLFEIEPTNLTLDTAYQSYIYDGFISDIQLVSNKNVLYRITLGSISNKRTLNDYYKLLKYIEEIKHKY
jgi:hypothetical protein